MPPTTAGFVSLFVLSHRLPPAAAEEADVKVGAPVDEAGEAHKLAEGEVLERRCLGARTLVPEVAQDAVQRIPHLADGEASSEWWR